MIRPLMKSLKQLEAWVGSFTISIVVTLGIFLACDVLYGMFNTESITKRRFIYGAPEPRPYSGFGVMPYGQYMTSLNEKMGVKAQGEKRIFIVGGSTVAVSNPPIDEYLEEYFAQHNAPHVKVFKFGVAASTLSMDLSRLVFELARYQPDVVIFYGGGNDIVMPAQSDPRPGVPPNFFSTEANPIFLSSKHELSWRALLTLVMLKSNILYATMYDRLMLNSLRLDELRATQGWMSKEWIEQVAQTLVDDVKRTYQVTTSLHITPIVVFQPLLYTKQTLSEKEQEYFSDFYLNLTTTAQKKLLTYAGTLNPQHSLFLDLTSIFNDRTSQVFVDGIHLAKGYQEPINEAVAQYVARHAAQELNLAVVH